MTRPADHVELIREVFRYAHAFQGRTFVLQIDDGIVPRPEVSSLVRDVVLLWRTGIRIVLVAGARTRIDEVLEKYSIACSRHNGVRISTPEAIPFIRMAAFDVANRLMTLLAGQGVNAVIGNWVRARSMGVVDGVDYQEAGTVDRVQVDLLRSVIDQGSIPILPCIGWSLSGKPYNVSSRELATELAIALGSSKLFFVSDVDPLTTERYRVTDEMDPGPDGRISRLTVDQARRFLELNAALVDDPARELVTKAVRAAAAGVERVHILDGRSEGVILQEIFSNIGIGTMVHSNQYQAIRRMRRDDVPDVYRLMRPLVEKGLLVERHESDLVERLEDFVVFETDGMVHGCGGLHLFEDGQAEIAGLTVDGQYEHFGIGQQIVRFLIQSARNAKLRAVFVLTTQASDWFEQLGFRPGSIADIPRARRERYDLRRKSRILVYDLQ